MSSDKFKVGERERVVLAQEIQHALLGPQMNPEAFNKVYALLAGAAEQVPSAPPSGYAYRYADCIRFNHGESVNGGKPIEAIPYYFTPPAQSIFLSEARKLVEKWRNGIEPKELPVVTQTFNQCADELHTLIDKEAGK